MGASVDREKRGRQRPHKPDELGPRLYRRGAHWHGDLRPWGGRRCALRDPGSPTWPGGGDRTQDRATALRWSLEYVDRLEDARNRQRIGLPPSHRTVEEAVHEYRAHRLRTVEENTVAADRTAFLHLTEFVGASAPLDVLRPETVQRLADHLLQQGFLPSTVGTYIKSICGLGKWLKLPSLWEGVRLPDRGRTDVPTWSDEELGKLRDVADCIDGQKRHGPSTRLALEAAVCTGARQMELFSLERKDFDPEGCMVRIHRQLLRDREGFKPLKGKRGRTAAVLPGFWEHFEPGPGLLLPGREGRPYDYSSHRRLVGRLLDAAFLNASGLAWHSFRHTYSRLFMERGCSLEELQKSLGHASYRVTETAYGHFRADVAARSAVGKLYQGEPLRIIQGGG